MSIAIKELRDRTNLSQREFANKYGIPISTLRKWEQGDTTPASYVVSMTIFSFDKGEEISTHAAGGDAMVIVY